MFRNPIVDAIVGVAIETGVCLILGVLFLPGVLVGTLCLGTEAILSLRS
jgi:hypothetical protein